MYMDIYMYIYIYVYIYIYIYLFVYFYICIYYLPVVLIHNDQYARIRDGASRARSTAVAVGPGYVSRIRAAVAV